LTLLGSEGMIGVMRVVLFILILAGLGLAGCGPEESESVRQNRAARAREAAEMQELLKNARQDVRERHRELGMSSR